MSTTYTKVRAVLGELNPNEAVSATDLRTKLLSRDKNRGETIFHISRKGLATPQEISEKSFNFLFGEMLLLGLLEKTANDDLVLHKSVVAVLDDETKFQTFLSRKVNELFQKSNFSISDVKAAAGTINYPNVRDANTILDELQKNKKAGGFSRDRFRRLLFLLSSARLRAKRNVRVFYEFS